MSRPRRFTVTIVFYGDYEMDREYTTSVIVRAMTYMMQMVSEKCGFNPKEIKSEVMVDD